MTNGYLVIDLGGRTFVSGTAQTISGLYAKIQKADKPVLLCNATFGSTVILPYIAYGVVGSNKFTFTVGADTLEITSADAVTYTVAE